MTDERSPRASDPRAAAVLDWWIGPAPQDATWLDARQRLWFRGGSEVDARIADEFGDAMQAAADGQLDAWARSPADWLALLILLDQFPRNRFRDDARAFAQDARALRLAREGIAQGHDQRLPPAWRMFAYLPFEHAEELSAQERSVALFENLQREAEPWNADVLRGWLDYARRHREPIARFGRFPHRNRALGRDTTAAEAEWLAQHPMGF